MRQSITKTLLSAVVANGSSDVKSVGIYDTVSFQVVATAVTTGANVLIEVSEDGTNFKTYHTFAIVTNGTDIYSIAHERILFARTTISGYTDGTYTVTLVAGGA